MNASLGGAKLNSDYVSARAAALVDEIEHVARWCPAVRELAYQSDQFTKSLRELRLDVCFDDWLYALKRYRGLATAMANRLNEASRISRPYASMDEFWSDADAQRTGASPYTFWDTYEHGRRRQIERTIAKVYGADDALLLNAGMSAICVAIEAADLRPGDRIVTGLQNYFETSEYLNTYVANRGIEIIRTPIGNAEAMRATIVRAAPRLVIFETTTNSPDAEVPLGLGAWLSSSANCLFVCDNTVQGPLTKWFSDPRLAAIRPRRLLVVESATKYISRSIMAGIVYGSRELVDRAREFARATGQHLQEKAFNHLREGDLLHVSKRLKLHSRNVEIFADALPAPRQGRFSVRFLCGERKHGCHRPELFAEGVGGIIFVVPRSAEVPTDAAPILCRRVLTSWQERLRALGYALPVRAGFGWSGTSARIYETGALNQRSAPSYLRLSIGIEPAEVARRLSVTLCEALEAAP